MRALLLLFLFLIVPDSGWGTDVVEEEREEVEKAYVFKEPVIEKERSQGLSVFDTVKSLKELFFNPKGKRSLKLVAFNGTNVNNVTAESDGACPFIRFPKVLLQLLAKDHLISVPKDIMEFSKVCKYFYQSLYGFRKAIVNAEIIRRTRGLQTSIPRLLIGGLRLHLHQFKSIYSELICL